MTTGSFSNERCIMQIIILCLCLYKYNPPKQRISGDMFGLKFIDVKNILTATDTGNERINN